MPDGRRGWVVAVHGAKGGVGTSVLAAQIALTAAGCVPAALVDLDVTGGTVSVLLGLEERGSVLSLLPPGLHGDGPGREAVVAAARLHPSGLRVLAAEPFDEHAGLLTGPGVRDLLGFVRGAFDVVVVDVPARMDDRGLGALSVADVVLLVVTPEVPCVVAARRLVEALARHGFPLGRVWVLVNMVEVGVAGGVAPERIAAALSLRLAGAVPFAPGEVRVAVDHGREGGGVLQPGLVRAAVEAVAAEVLPMALVAGGRWRIAGGAVG